MDKLTCHRDVIFIRFYSGFLGEGSSPFTRTTKSLENAEFSRLFAFYFPLSHGGWGMHHLSILVHFQNADMAVGLLFLSLTNSISLLIILAVNSCVHFLYAPLPKQIL